MKTPYGLELIDSCIGCKKRLDRSFCDLSSAALRTFESIKYAALYPQGAMLFREGQPAQGIYVLCSGRVRLSICTPHGKMLILKIASAGEVLGLSSTVSGEPSEITAETLVPCQLTFVKRSAFRDFMVKHSEACFRVAEQLGNKYHFACCDLLNVVHPRTAGERLAMLLLSWVETSGQSNTARLKLTTHEDISQMINTSRETVTRLFADLQKRAIVQTSKNGYDFARRRNSDGTITSFCNRCPLTIGRTVNAKDLAELESAHVMSTGRKTSSSPNRPSYIHPEDARWCRSASNGRLGLGGSLKLPQSAKVELIRAHLFLHPCRTCAKSVVYLSPNDERECFRCQFSLKRRWKELALAVPMLPKNRQIGGCHEVQLYSGDEFFLDRFAGFIGAALRVGDAVIVAATPRSQSTVFLIQSDFGRLEMLSL